MDFGRLLMIIGALILLTGLILSLVGKVPYIGRLPGDILISRGNVTFYFPLTTSILISIILSILFWLFTKR